MELRVDRSELDCQDSLNFSNLVWPRVTLAWNCYPKRIGVIVVCSVWVCTVELGSLASWVEGPEWIEDEARQEEAMANRLGPPGQPKWMLQWHDGWFPAERSAKYRPLMPR